MEYVRNVSVSVVLMWKTVAVLEFRQLLSKYFESESHLWRRFMVCTTPASHFVLRYILFQPKQHR